MSSAVQNRSIAKHIVGAMTIDGKMDKKEREKVAQTLKEIGMAELVADVGAAIEDDDGQFNLHAECGVLLESLKGDADELTPLIFRIVVDVVANDRFVSEREALYLSSLAKRLSLSISAAQAIFKQVMVERRSRLEIAANSVDELINPQLKELLDFKGAEDLVGEVDPNSLEELAHQAGDLLSDQNIISREELARALTVLGLGSNSTLENAGQVWKDTIENLNLPKMADLGETFVSAAINRITRVNSAYKTVLQFEQQVKIADKG